MHTALDQVSTGAEISAINAWVADAGLSRAAVQRLTDHAMHARTNLPAGTRTPWVDAEKAKRAAKRAARAAKNSAWEAKDVDGEQAFLNRPLTEMSTSQGLGRDLVESLETGRGHWTIVHRRELSDGTIVAAVALSERRWEQAEREFGGFEDLSGVAYVDPSGHIEFSIGQHGIIAIVEQQADALERAHGAAS